MKKLILVFALLIPIMNNGVSAKTIPQNEFIPQATIDQVTKSMLASFGEKNKFRIDQGVKQTASFWNEKDGTVKEFETFCMQNFYDTDEKLSLLFDKLSTAFEVLNGNFLKMTIDLKIPLHLDAGEITPIDEMFGGYDPSAHLTDDLFQNKTAFIVTLNFPSYTLTEKMANSAKWTRKEWAYAKIGDLFTSRVPADLLLKVGEILSEADSYIASYNIYMGNLVDNNMKTFFPKDLKLITHWGLRDELKSHYSEADGLTKQKMIYEVMKHIIFQDIPSEVINSNKLLWNPVTNKTYKESAEVTNTPEPNTRYQHMLDNFHAMKNIDKYSPQCPTYISRKFDQEMQISQADVEKLFIEFCSSPQVKKVAALISKRLKRKLEPFDIWYDGFKPRSSINESELDKMTKAKYPTKDAFEKDLPNILVKLGFTAEKAKWITSKITVDASRGAGHAQGAAMKGDKARLRTRVQKDGMDYKGYNIAVHEFGHTVEQTITLNEIDYYMLNGVPNTACTEAVAFMFQQKDLEFLGIKNDDVNKKHLFTLDNFWAAYEIMGVSLVDMNTWKWLYAHPDATPQQLKEAVITIAKDVWNKYYADVFGVKDQPILAIYSHMIDSPLYLSAYPVGHLIDFQIERFMDGKNFGTEIEKILLNGSIVPQQWMKNAVGSEISTKPMLDATDEALKIVTQ